LDGVVGLDGYVLCFFFSVDFIAAHFGWSIRLIMEDQIACLCPSIFVDYYSFCFTIQK